MRSFKIITLGCKVNQYESDAIDNILRQNGWHPAGAKEAADACIINTCTVTQKASMQSRQAIRHTIRANPDARIVVTGCYAQTQPDEIAQIPGVHDIIGHAYKHKIPDALLTGRHARAENSPIQIIRNIFNEQIFKQTPGIPASNRTRAFLKIQDGCDAFCTYCIVPHARGRSRSMPIEDVLTKIEAIRNAGHKEVVLTGINLGRYGADLSTQNGRLLNLLYTIESKRLIERVRLSSIEPMELDKDIIALVAESKIICRHFHIPLQSGDNAILKRMHRPYSREQYTDLLRTIQRYVPDAAIGADILVGFPGETDEAFENSRALIESQPITYLHVFPYSARPGTPAANFPEHPDSDLVKVRSRILRELGHQKRLRFHQQAIGQEVKVLVEEKRVTDLKLLKGMTSNYIPVLFQGSDSLKNELVTVRITKLLSNDLLFGELKRIDS